MTQTAPPGTTYPGKTLGIVGLVLAFVFSLVGLILSAIALSQSKQAGYKNTPAKVGLILGIIFTAISVIWTIVAIAGMFAVASTGVSVS